MLNVLLYLNYSFFALKKQNFLCSRGWSQVYDAPASAFLSAQIIGFDTTRILTLSYLIALIKLFHSTFYVMIRAKLLLLTFTYKEKEINPKDEGIKRAF